LKDRLHIVPPVPAEAIVSYIASADAGIYFMWPETRNIDLTIPNKLFEFSLSGLPLVVTDLTSTRWFCEQAKNAVLVSEKEPEAVARACRQAYKNARKLKPKKRALEAIRLEFSWEAQGAKLVRFYEALFRESA
jgi:glycosyltransferase involved in cell wall biosynthesis